MKALLWQMSKEESQHMNYFVSFSKALADSGAYPARDAFAIAYIFLKTDRILRNSAGEGRKMMEISCDTLQTILPVRPNDLDSLGHVNNAVALEYLETGRLHWMESQGLQGGKEIFPLVARAEVDSIREIRRGLFFSLPRDNDTVARMYR